MISFLSKFNFFFNKKEDHFILDPRSLSLFRVGLALLILTDFIFVRREVYTLFFGDGGIYPVRNALQESSWVGPSLYFIWVGSWFQCFLYYLTIVLGFLFLIGYKTKWVGFGLWALVCSIISRNYLVNNSGDFIVVLMLFWSLFLPLSGYWSVDGALDNLKKPGKQLKNLKTSIYAKAFIFQILFVYIFAFLLKSSSIWREDGTAVYYALALDMFRTYQAEILMQFPLVMKALTFITVYFFELGMPVCYLLFGRIWYVRLFIVLLMMGFHVGLGFFLWLGAFPFVCIVYWTGLLPPEFWDKIQNYLKRWQSRFSVTYDGTCTFCEKSAALIKSFFILPFVNFKGITEEDRDTQAYREMKGRSSWVVHHQERGWAGRWHAFIHIMSCSPLFYPLHYLARLKLFEKPGEFFYNKISSNRETFTPFLSGVKEQTYTAPKLFKGIPWIFVCFCFIYVLFLNIKSTKIVNFSSLAPRYFFSAESFFLLYQNWAMYAPSPMNISLWIVLEAETKDGKKINVLNPDEPLHYEKPKRFINHIDNYRVRKMMENISLQIQDNSKGHEKILERYLNYHCNKWNNQGVKKEDQIKSIKFTLLYDKVSFPEPGKNKESPKIHSISKEKILCMTDK